MKRLTVRKDPKYKIDVKEVQERGLEECSYHPTITKMPKFKPKQMPKSYTDAISRMKKSADERKTKREEEEKIITEVGLRLERLRKLKPNPPSFLSRSSESKKKRDVLIYIDVSVSAGK